MKAVAWFVFNVLVLLTPAQAQQFNADQGSKTIAFVLGIEHYVDDDMDKLKYVIKDARDVFDQFRAVTNFDNSRSWLLLGDRDATDAEQRDNTLRIVRKKKWSTGEIRNEFQRFLRAAKDADTILIYIGGHGTASLSSELLLTASDYDPDQKLNFIPYTDLMGDIARELKGANRARVSVGLFLNVCGAGSASGALSVSADIAEAARRLKEVGIGEYDFALFPATAPKEDAFEDYEKRQRSVFAHALIEGLQGKAAEPNGDISAIKLFQVIEAEVNKFRGEKGIEGRIELPRDDRNFAQSMKIGRVKNLQGEADFLVATSLLAAAHATDVPVTAETDDDRVAQSKLLTELAISQFGQAVQRTTTLRARAKLKRVMARLALGAAAGSQEVARDIRSLEQDKSGLSATEITAIEMLISNKGERSGIETLKDLRDQLAAGENFSYLLLTTDDTVNYFPRQGRGSYTQPWDQFLSSFPGGHQISVDHIASSSAVLSLSEELLEKISGRAAKSSNERLIVVFDGPLRRMVPGVNAFDAVSIDQATRQGLKLSLRPFGRTELEKIASIWKGPITFVLEAPYGGHLLDDKPIAGADISLLLAAREKNGMTSGAFMGTLSGPREPALLLVWADGALDPASHPAHLAIKQKLTRELLNTPRTYGTPVWIPDWSKAAPTQAAMNYLQSLDQWVAMLATACATEAFDVCSAKAAARLGAVPSDPFADLVKAGVKDMNGMSFEAAEGYTQAASGLETLARMSAPSAFAQAAATNALANTLTQVKRRVTGAWDKAGRQIHLLYFGVEGYESPFIARLPHTMADLASYKTGLGDRLRMLPAASLNDSQPAAFNTAKDILDALAKVRAETTERDLVLLVFSGRGMEKNGRRYLVTGSAFTGRQTDEAIVSNRVNRSGDRNQSPFDHLSKEELVDLWTIADQMRDRWFIGIYDAQFTMPVSRTHYSQILDKHIHSVRPDPVPQSVEAAQSVRLLARGELPLKQVHIWVDGRLTGASEPQICDPENRMISPLAAAVSQSVSQKALRTYRNLIELMARGPCFQGNEDSTIVAQGDLDLPAFASGDGAEFIEYFETDSARRGANLLAAGGVAEEAVQRFSNPYHRLSQAAVLVTLMRFYKERSEVLQIQGQFQRWREEAQRLLNDLKYEEFAGSDNALDIWAMRTELAVRLYDIIGDTSRAFDLLRDVYPFEVLGLRNLASTLVYMGGKRLKQQSVDILNQVTQKFASFQGGVDDQILTAKRQLNELVKSEENRRRELFSIKQPKLTTTDRR